MFLLPISFVFFVLHNRRKRFSAGIFRITVLQNGVLVQNNTTIKGTTFLEHPAYTAHGDAPIMLQDHGNAVRFRNIWIREL